MVVLISGGSGSGKSKYAENLMIQRKMKSRLYIATMRPWDRECRERIRKHRLMRSRKRFKTMECYQKLWVVQFPERPSVLLECVSNLALNEYYINEEDEDKAHDAILRSFRSLVEQCENVVIVTNDIFSDGESYDAEITGYLRLLGRVNRELAGMAQQVIQIVCGIPVVWKDETAKEARI